MFLTSNRYNVLKIVPPQSVIVDGTFCVDVVFYWNRLTTDDVTVNDLTQFKRND